MWVVWHSRCVCWKNGNLIFAKDEKAHIDEEQTETIWNAIREELKYNNVILSSEDIIERQVASDFLECIGIVELGGVSVSKPEMFIDRKKYVMAVTCREYDQIKLQLHHYGLIEDEDYVLMSDYI